MLFAVVDVSLVGVMDLKILSAPTGTFPIRPSLYLLGDYQPVGGSEKVEVFEVKDIGLDLLPVKSVDDSDHFFA